MLCADLVVGASCPVVDGGISTCFRPFLFGGILYGCMLVSAGVSVTPRSRGCSSWHLEKNFQISTVELGTAKKGMKKRYRLKT